MPPRVLIVGAGPTGLVLACWLARLGVACRIVDRNSGPGTASRAIAVHARTLEFHRQLGIATEAVARGIRMREFRLRRGGRPVATLRLGDFGEGLSPFPFVLSLPQDEHERLLLDALGAAGVAVEWDTEVRAVADDGRHVRATLRTPAGEESVEVAWVCGCDGVHSTVREHLGVGFPGGTYEQTFYVADVRVAGAPIDGSVVACLDPRLFCLVFPIRTTGMHRLIGIVPPELGGRPALAFDDLRPVVERLARVRVESVNWFSTYHVHHRVAEHFRRGRGFLAGDAGHVHSPAGGQGMNTGIGDAVNLAWKLAHVVRGRAAPSLLDTYEPERIAFARRLVATTDTAFRFIVDGSLRGRLVRTAIVPRLAPLALRLPFARRLAFRTVSQIGIEYRESPLSQGVAGRVHGGDRLPWVEPDDNFAPLAALDWQAHVYGAATEAVRAALGARAIALHAFPWSEGAAAVGFARDALYLVRPDGHVAVAAPQPDVAAIDRVASAFTPAHDAERR
jgi:2-polyprenyl-6-methoxyphenol hydroxylase-like FAD-dependent oxidoreductase